MAVFFSSNHKFSLLVLIFTLYISAGLCAGGSKIEYSAKDKIKFDVDREILNLEGNAKISFENSTLTADKITYFSKKNIVIASGNPVLQDKSTTVYCDSIILNTDTKRGILYNSRTKFGNAFYYSHTLWKTGDDVFDIDDGYYTTCDHIHPHTSFRSYEMRLYRKDKFIAKPVILYVKKVPILILPFIIAPQKKGKRSGILLPSYTYSDGGGRQIRNLGYYYYYSDYFDATMYMNYMQKAYWSADLNTNYKKRYFFDGSTKLNFTDNFRGGEDYGYSITSHNTYKGNPTYILHLDYTSSKQQRDQSDTWESRYQQDFKSYLTLSSYKLLSGSSLGGKITFNKNIETDKVTLTLPNFSFNFTNNTRFGCNFSYTDDPEKKSKTILLPKITYTIPGRSLVENDNEDKEDRWYHKIYHNHSFELKSTSEFRDSLYFQGLSNIYDPDFNTSYLKQNGRFSYKNKLIGIFNYSLSTNYEYKLYNKKYTENSPGLRYKTSYSSSTGFDLYGYFFPEIGNLRQMRHILTPSIGFSWTPRQGGQDIITEGDKDYIEDSKSMSISLANILQLKLKDMEGEDGKEKTIGQFITTNSSTSYNFRNEEWADISSTIGLNPGKLETEGFSAEPDAKLSIVNDFETLRKKSLSIDASFTFRGKMSLPRFKHRHVSDTVLASGFFQDYKDSISQVWVDKNWSLLLDLSYGEYAGRKSYDLNIDFNTYLTANWQVSYFTDWDLKENELKRQKISIIRNLHCWEAQFTWEKDSRHWEYKFQINLKEFPDDIKLKLNERRY